MGMRKVVLGVLLGVRRVSRRWWVYVMVTYRTRRLGSTGRLMEFICMCSMPFLWAMLGMRPLVVVLPVFVIRSLTGLL